ncbi:hypothetical protein H0E87_010918 [Populus deltoides]|uniref:Amino acid transporter transmembrane domain-containing protein n=2 Tax=Populus deltoides TaxID=3696 RepID=A0A8T2YVD6_POPDE|nr:hypothetical protein H0E87_010918 [Populus deltoides]
MKMGENTATKNHLPPQAFSVSVDTDPQSDSKWFDDDGRPKRTGNVWTASAHIITAVIGSGVLSLAWAIGQLGWIAGPAVMLLFSFVTYYTSILLSACYRSGDPDNGKRNYTYMDAVRANLGGVKVKICGFVQYVNLFGVAIGYTIASSISMMAIKRSNCFHQSGGKDPCRMNANPYMIGFGIAEILLSQIPGFDQLHWLSLVAAVMSFTYSTIGLGLGIVGLLGAFGFWPLTVYFPVEMYISQKKIPKWSTRWLCLQILSVACLIITIAAAAGSIAGVIDDVKTIKPFKTSY